MLRISSSIDDFGVKFEQADAIANIEQASPAVPLDLFSGCAQIVEDDDVFIGRDRNIGARCGS